MEYDVLFCPFIFFRMINRLWWAVKTKDGRGLDEGHDKVHPVILDHNDSIWIPKQ